MGTDSGGWDEGVQRQMKVKNITQIKRNIVLKKREKERKTDRQTEAERETDRQREAERETCLLYTSPSPRDRGISRMPSSA